MAACAVSALRRCSVCPTSARMRLRSGLHAYLLQRKYPHAEIAFSCPRLRPIINNDKINPKDVHEPQLLQVVCAYRIFMPFASITISTRERQASAIISSASPPPRFPRRRRRYRRSLRRG